MRWTFQRRLSSIVGLTVVMLLVVVVVDLLSVRQTRLELAAIESQYVPLLDLGPAVQADFAAVNRRLQEAVTAQDPEAQEEALALKDHLLQRLDTAPAIVSRASLDQLKRAIDDWYRAASDVARQLIRGDTGEEVIGEIEQMQRRQREVMEQIRQTVYLDRRRLEAAFDEARHQQEVASQIRLLVPLLLTLLVAALALGIGRRVIRSFQALSNGFTRFGRGDFDTPIEIRGNDELADLASHANRMAAQLRDAKERLQRQALELRQTNKELEAFSYSVSHDLRAPLRSIDGVSQALLEDYADRLPDEGQDFLRRVRAAAQRMAQLIDDLLRLSRISRSEMRWEPVDLTALARTVAQELAVATPGRAVDVSVAEGLCVTGDPQLLRIALENLIGNAWKFASKVDRPKIEVGVSVDEGEPTYFVRDNGAGFDMSRVEKLFTPFQRLHHTSDFPGTGIGLATVQRIVHRHGGRVRAEGAVGQGATFHFTLPSILPSTEERA